MFLPKIYPILLLSLFILPSAPLLSQKGKPEVTGGHWQKWLNEDVVYIISEEEEAVFKKLTTEEEREQFVEQFWQRRDPDPRTPENEFRTEHYRRIRYANERFHAGIPGWKTDRGMVYIKYGEPDRIESHPIGGPYARPEQEGGGHTSTYPFEIWNYRYLEGIGQDVEIEFVDLSGANLYKMTSNPWDKDEFIHMPSMGYTWAEEEARDPEKFAELRASRISGFRRYGSGESQGIQFERQKYTPFARSELVANLTAPPPIKFTDLRTAVSTKITYNSIPFRAESHFVRMTDEYVMAPLALEFPNSALSFDRQYGLNVSKLQVYGMVTNLVGKLIYEFDDEIVNQYTDQVFEREKEGASHYYRSLALKPGRYKLQLVVKDEVADRMGTVEMGLFPPVYNPEKLAASSVIFTSKLGSAPPERAFRDPYVFGRFKLRPRFEKTFHNDEYLGAYFEIYNIAVDPSTEKPSLQVEYALRSRDKQGEPKFINITKGISYEPDHVSVPLYIDISSRPAGNYEVIFKVRDVISGQNLRISERFRIEPQSARK